MQQRYYDPIAGRFLSVDPIVTDGNTGRIFNRYSYAGSNPYSFVDPDGKYLFYFHFIDTYSGARENGFSVAQSLRFAFRAVQVDFERGSQAVTEAAVARHGMSIPGQDIDTARANHLALIESAIASKDLGLASHATEDPFSGSHQNYATWSGYTGIANFVRHIFHDAFRSDEEASAAKGAVSAMFKRARNQANSSEVNGTQASEGDGVSRHIPLSSQWITSDEIDRNPTLRERDWREHHGGLW